MLENSNREAITKIAIILTGALALWLPGCSTAPKVENQAAFIESAAASRTWFESNVTGLHDQIESADAYLVFPDVAQWGTLILGGKFGRGALLKPDGTQLGWGSINNSSIGLQVGVQGFKMLIVIENSATLEKFKSNSWAGSADAVVIAGEAGGNAVAPFRNGISVYTGANRGVMAGASVGLQYIRYKPRWDD